LPPRRRNHIDTTQEFFVVKLSNPHTKNSVVKLSNPHTQEQGYRQLGEAAAQGERGRTVLKEARLSERGQIYTHGSTDLLLGR
jgi:hypothetical protein